MRISIFCSSEEHPVFDSLVKWAEELRGRGYSVSLLSIASDLTGGDLLFLVSCHQIIKVEVLQLFSAALVVHASDLPMGRGWSPHVWAVLNGHDEITVSLVEAAEPVDTGAIWSKTRFTLEGHELFDEINEKLFKAEIELMNLAVEQFRNIVPTPQIGPPGKYLPRRTPEDSRINPDKSIADQFDLLRVCDSERYPAFFEYRGAKYSIKISKIKDD